MTTFRAIITVFASNTLKLRLHPFFPSVVALSRAVEMKAKVQSDSSSQRTITAFFTKQQQMSSAAGAGEKRKNDENVGAKEGEEPTKKLKTEEGAQCEPTAVGQSLTPEQKNKIAHNKAIAQLRLLAHQTPLIDPNSIGLSWFTNILDAEFRKPYFKELSDFYIKASSRATVYPKLENIFSWTRHCELGNVKVVIIGQDPYHGANQSHGLCFSVQKGVATPPSLLNMYKELVADKEVEGFTEVPRHGHLVGLAEQGVLLLNAVLTVEAAKANSHQGKGWENLTTAVIKWISKNSRNVVFLLWGSYAQKMGSVVDKGRHTVLTSVHPSPLSAHRGFLGCKHFSKCNKALRDSGKGEIQWEYLP